jgi:phenylalanyl-tRNA synthetase beta chain
VALRRAIALMHRIGAGRLSGPIVDRYPAPRGPKTLRLRRAAMARLLGLVVPDAEVERILRRLELPAARTDEGWEVVAPTFRVDLGREVDLIEEIGRHYGFDKLDSTFPPITVAAAPADDRVPRDQLVRRVLTTAGLSEAVSFAFIESDAARAFLAADAEPVAVANPLSAKFEVLRPSLLPGLLDAVAHNRRHGRRDVALFEVGARFTPAAGEIRSVGLVVSGGMTPEHWSGRSRDVDFFDVKGIVERLCEALGLVVAIRPGLAPFLVEGHAASLSTDGTLAGVFGLLRPAIVERSGAPRDDQVFVAEIDLDRLAGHVGERVRALPRYPSVVRDLSIVVSDVLPAEIIRGTIQQAGSSTIAPLAAISVFDRYKGRGIPDGAVSLSVRLTFQSPDRTLTDAEVQEAFDRIVAALVRDHGAIQR